MADNLLDDLKIGIKAQIILISGKEVLGRVVRTDSQFVVLEKAEGGTAKYAVAALAGWEILADNEHKLNSPTPDSLSKINDSISNPLSTSLAITFPVSEDVGAVVTPVLTEPVRGETVQVTLAPKSEIPQSPHQWSSEVTAALVEIKNRFMETHATLSLTPLPLKLSTADGRILSDEGKLVSFDEYELLYVRPDANGRYDEDARNAQSYIGKIKKEFNRVKNVWDHTSRLASRPGEHHRLDSLIQSLKELTRDCWDVPAFPFNQGCIYLKVGKPIEAMDAFGIAAIYGKDGSAFFNLAAAALEARHRSIACYALQRLFASSPIKEPSLWRLCVVSSAELAAMKLLPKVFQRQARTPDAARMSLLIESLIFLLDARAEPDAACELVAQLRAKTDLNMEDFHSMICAATIRCGPAPTGSPIQD